MDFCTSLTCPCRESFPCDVFPHRGPASYCRAPCAASFLFPCLSSSCWKPRHSCPKTMSGRAVRCAALQFHRGPGRGRERGFVRGCVVGMPVSYGKIHPVLAFCWRSYCWNGSCWCIFLSSFLPVPLATPQKDFSAPHGQVGLPQRVLSQGFATCRDALAGSGSPRTASSQGWVVQAGCCLWLQHFPATANSPFATGLHEPPASPGFRSEASEATHWHAVLHRHQMVV
mmetsp:Transcript_140310/g.349783  ORF Transcript_140310/g.349783 Transcript_140310/m.349783 type:complete len:228 (+) Transcript_140310:3647-4330(+)